LKAKVEIELKDRIVKVTITSYPTSFMVITRPKH